MMRGISREKPAEVPARRMERIWSVYEVIGESIRLKEDQPMCFYRERTEHGFQRSAKG